MTSSIIAPPHIHWKAVASPLCVILAFVAWIGLVDRCASPLWAVPSFLFVFAALYLGHRSRLDIHRQPAQLKGKTIAFLGLSLSYALLLGGLLAILPAAFRSRQAKSESAAVCNLMEIADAEASYVSRRRGYASLAELIDAKLLDPKFSAPVEGYQLSVTVSAGVYTASAEQVSTNTGGHGYYVVPDGIVRYSTAMTMAPSGMSGKPVW
jgi:hypothetical protein